MKYLKLFESFYTPTSSYKSNVGSDEINDAGANTYPYNSSKIDDEEVAFKKGEEAYEKGMLITDNPYVEQQYPNTNLIKSWTQGWENGEKNYKLDEAVVNVIGDLEFPDYLSTHEEDTPNDAYDKGRQSFFQGCDLDENPYMVMRDSSDYEKELNYAWDDGYLLAKRSTL